MAKKRKNFYDHDHVITSFFDELFFCTTPPEQAVIDLKTDDVDMTRQSTPRLASVISIPEHPAHAFVISNFFLPSLTTRIFSPPFILFPIPSNPLPPGDPSTLSQTNTTSAVRTEEDNDSIPSRDSSNALLDIEDDPSSAMIVSDDNQIEDVPKWHVRLNDELTKEPDWYQHAHSASLSPLYLCKLAILHVDFLCYEQWRTVIGLWREAYPTKSMQELRLFVSKLRCTNIHLFTQKRSRNWTLFRIQNVMQCSWDQLYHPYSAPHWEQNFVFSTAGRYNPLPYLMPTKEKIDFMKEYRLCFQVRSYSVTLRRIMYQDNQDKQDNQDSSLSSDSNEEEEGEEEEEENISFEQHHRFKKRTQS